MNCREYYTLSLSLLAYSSKKDLKEEQVQRILTRVKPSMRRWLKTADILPFLKKRCVLMESEIQHLKTEALAPEEQVKTFCFFQLPFSIVDFYLKQVLPQLN